MQKLREETKKYSFFFAYDLDDELAYKILLIYTKDVIDEDCNDAEYINAIGLYYEHVKHDMKKSIKYLEKASKFATDKNKGTIENNLLSAYDKCEDWDKELKLPS